MQENQYNFKEIADLLQWQYDYCTKLDNLLVYNVRGYRSIFSIQPTKQQWFSRGFIEQTIRNLNQFWRGPGKHIEITTRNPYKELIDSESKADAWLTTFINDFDSNETEAIDQAIMHLDWQEMTMVNLLKSFNRLLISVESDYVQRLDSQQAGSIIRNRLATIARDRLINQNPALLHQTYRDLEHDVYSALEKFIEANEARDSQKAIQEAKANLRTVINSITTSGNGNVINTGNDATVTATIHQQSVGHGVTAESVADEIRQFTTQIRELLERENVNEETKEDITHQLTAVERQVSRETPNFTIAGKALSVVETLLTDALSNQTAPVILAGIHQVMAHIQTLSI